MKALRKIVLLLILTLALLYTSGYFLDKMIIHYVGPLNDKNEEVFNGTGYYDLVFLGNSKTKSGLNPKIIDSLTGLSSYNMSDAGANAIELQMLWNAFISKHPAPRYAIIQADFSEYADFNKDDVNTKVLYTFYAGNPYVQDVYKKRFKIYPLIPYMPFLKYSLFSDYYRYLTFEGFLGKSLYHKGAISYRGFYNTDTTFLTERRSTPSLRDQNSMYFSVDSANLHALKNMISSMHKHNVKVLYLPFPVFNYFDEIEHKKLAIFFADVAGNKNDECIIDINESGQTFDSCFVDNLHLNKRGSERLSLMTGKALAESGILKTRSGE